MTSACIALGLLFVGMLATVAGPAEGATGPAFPLRAAEDGRCLVDKKGVPFLLVGDTAWSLIAQLPEAEIERYLADRQRRGFNAIIVNMLERKFSTHPPNTHGGLEPFTTPDDFSTPNDAYFDYAHHAVERARAHGIVVWLAPAYLGYGGGDEGFFKEIKAGGRERLRAYGRYLGRRFRDLSNIVWMVGGDYTPPEEDEWAVTELAAGLRDADPHCLVTAHTAPEATAATAYGARLPTAIDTVYSYQPALLGPLLAAEQRRPRLPFVLIETTYEGEHDSVPAQIRRQAYWAMLAGACGQFFGNNPIWHFDGPGLFKTPYTWQQALDGPGSRDMQRLRDLFAALPWSHLAPEENHDIVREGYGDRETAAQTAHTPDRRLAVTYVPATAGAPRELVVDLGRFPAPVVARWYDPTSALYRDVPGAPLRNEGTARLQTPGANAAGDTDWVLVLQSR